MKLNKLCLSLLLASSMLFTSCDIKGLIDDTVEETTTTATVEETTQDSEESVVTEETSVEQETSEEESSEEATTIEETSEEVNACSWYVSGERSSWGGTEAFSYQMSDDTDYVATVKVNFQQGDAFYVINKETEITLGYTETNESQFTLKGDNNAIVIDFNINLYVSVTTDNKVSIRQ